VTRFLLVFSLAFSLSLFVLFHAGNLAAPLFEDLLSAFITLTMITGTVSYALYAYVDTITKDVAGDKKVDAHESYRAAIEKLSDLKREVLINAFAVVGLLIIERLAHSISLAFPTSPAEPFNWYWAVTTSIRMACFSSSVVIVVIQFFAFIVASYYRRIISGKGK
jgi:hypothetical protein